MMQKYIFSHIQTDAIIAKYRDLLKLSILLTFFNLSYTSNFALSKMNNSNF